MGIIKKAFAALGKYCKLTIVIVIVGWLICSLDNSVEALEEVKS
jgi:hypothetical protein